MITSIVNDVFSQAVEKLKSVVVAEQCRTKRVASCCPTFCHVFLIFGCFSYTERSCPIWPGSRRRLSERGKQQFLLVMLASKRVKQLYKGSKPVIENKSSNKNVVLALREVAAGKIQYEMTSRRNR